jgi:hypothetical protein
VGREWFDPFSEFWSSNFFCVDLSEGQQPCSLFLFLSSPSILFISQAYSSLKGLRLPWGFFLVSVLHKPRHLERRQDNNNVISPFWMCLGILLTWLRVGPVVLLAKVCVLSSVGSYCWAIYSILFVLPFLWNPLSWISACGCSHTGRYLQAWFWAASSNQKLVILPWILWNQKLLEWRRALPSLLALSHRQCNTQKQKETAIIVVNIIAETWYWADMLADFLMLCLLLLETSFLSGDKTEIQRASSLKFCSLCRLLSHLGLKPCCSKF